MREKKYTNLKYSSESAIKKNKSVIVWVCVNWISCRKVFQSSHCFVEIFLNSICSRTAHHTSIGRENIQTLMKKKTINRNTMSDRIVHKRVTILLTFHIRWASTVAVCFALCRMHIDITFSSNFNVHIVSELLDWLRVNDLKQAPLTLTVELCLRESARANTRSLSLSLAFACSLAPTKHLICNLWFSKQIQLKSIDFQFFSSSSLLSIVFLFPLNRFSFQ